METNRWIRNHGSIEYIWAPQGVATVQQSKGLIMRWHAPEDNPLGSSLYYAKVLKPELNDIRVVRKGEDLTLTTDGTKGKFLYWYDAQNPEGSENGTDWTSATQTFSNIQRDMVLVPVRDPMTTGPNLSAVGYSEQYDSKTSTYTRYAYQDLTFASEDNISNGTGGYRVMLVPAQLPRYGENTYTYAARDLDNAPVMGLRSSRLYADANAAFSVSALNNQFRNIPPGSYRIAYDDDATGRCFISKPFTFDPPVASPYIDPISAVFEENDSGTKQVKITVERNKHIEYRVWNSSTNKWTSLRRYNGPFEVNVTAENDVRIEAYAGSSALGIKSEAYYSVRPSGVPTVKYGDTKISTTEATVPTHNYLGAIELTVEAPEGCEVWYRENYSPSESDMGTKAAENGKVVISGTGGSSKTIYFKLAKAFTVNGVTYRKLSHSVSKVNLKELTADTLPAPEVTVTPKSGGEPLTPSGNTYTIKEFVNVALEKSSGWPLNATLGYAYHGDTAPQYAKPYTTPFEVRGAQTVSVFALASNADGSIAHHRWLYQFKLDPSVNNYVLLVVRNATAYDSNGTVLVTDSNDVNASVNVQVGARIRVVPNVPSGKIFKNWSADGIYDTPNDKFKEELFFTMPDRSNMLILEAKFADQSEASITGDTKVLLAMGPTPQYNGVLMYGTVGDSVDLFINESAGVDYHALRTISYQWWEGDSVGTVDNALPTWTSFDKSKTYTVKVTITANEGVTFASTAGVQFGVRDGFLKMKDVTRSSDGKTLTFTATPLWTMDLPLPTLHDGDNLSGIEKSMNGQLMPLGYITDVRWESGTPNYSTTATTGIYYIEKLLLKPYSKSPLNRPLLDQKVVIDGTRYYHKSDENGNYVVVNYSASDRRRIPINVLPKGVTVSGTAVSWNNTDNAVYLLYPSATSDEAIRTEWKNNSYTGGAALYTGTGGAISATTVDGKSMQAQTFSFDTVAAGEYKLAIFKPGKYVPKIISVTVDSTDHDCGQLKLWLYGDVNYDGKVTATDATQVLRYFNNKSPNVFTSGTAQDQADRLLCADVNGDKHVTGTDATQIRRYFNNKTPNAIYNQK